MTTLEICDPIEIEELFSLDWEEHRRILKQPTQRFLEVIDDLKIQEVGPRVLDEFAEATIEYLYLNGNDASLKFFRFYPYEWNLEYLNGRKSDFVIDYTQRPDSDEIKVWDYRESPFVIDLTRRRVPAEETRLTLATPGIPNRGRYEIENPLVPFEAKVASERPLGLRIYRR